MRTATLIKMILTKRIINSYYYIFHPILYSFCCKVWIFRGFGCCREIWETHQLVSCNHSVMPLAFPMKPTRLVHLAATSVTSILYYWNSWIILHLFLSFLFLCSSWRKGIKGKKRKPKFLSSSFLFSPDTYMDLEICLLVITSFVSLFWWVGFS